MDYLSLEECQPGGIYRLRSRNLAFGVFDGKDGFMGIREKFYYRSLFTEYHYDHDGAYGTARPLEKVGQLQEGASLQERFQLCQVCNKAVDFDSTRGETAEERWQHVDGSQDHDVKSVSVQNKDIFQALEKVESDAARADRAANKLWMGNDCHSFHLTENDQKEQVTADQYMDKQDELGICMGMHHFAKDGVEGQISQG